MEAVHPDSSFLRFAAQDIWGYADARGEYALVCGSASLKVIDVTDPTQPVLASVVPAAGADLKDVKTYKHYAYCVNQIGPLQIVDLSDPYHAFTAATYSSVNIPGAHNIWVSQDGYAYLALQGIGRGDLRILDLADPLNPVERGHYAPRSQGDPTSSHDVYVRNDTCFASMFGDGLHILDVTNKDSPVQLVELRYPQSATHNAWPTGTGEYVCTTDEVSGGHLRIWQVDGRFPGQVAEYETVSPATIHNVHVKGHYAYISYYTAGVTIVDLTDPRHPVEIGRFDTNRRTGGGIGGGCWGVYPYAPSGLVYASDMHNGLFVLRFLDARDGLVRGAVRVHGAEAAVVEGAEVFFVEAEVRAVTDRTGFFQAKLYEGTHTGRASGPGFRTETFTVTVGVDEVAARDIVLDPLPGPLEFPEQPAPPVELADGRLAFEARVRAHGRAVARVTLHYRSGGAGGFRSLEMGRALENDETYLGYVPDQLPGTLVQYFFTAEDEGGQLVYAPADAPAALWSYRVGEVDWTPLLGTDFEDGAAGFTVGSPEDRGERGIWERVELIEVPDSLLTYERPTQPNADASRREGSGQGTCFLTELGGPEASPETHSVAGRTTLTSPRVDLTGAAAARLTLALWYVNDLGFGSTWQDPFLIEGSTDDGATWRVLESLRVVEPGWQKLTVDLGYRLELSDEVRVRFVAEDGISTSLIEAAIDDVRIETTRGLGLSHESGKTQMVLVRQNTPNPFNPSTVISYQLKEERPVRLAIYNGSGRLVRMLVDKIEGVGDHSVTWDGRTELGLHAPSGVYFYRLEALDFSQSRKMSLAR
jgi:choice-of-anchor B domain-containing protein